MDTYFPMHSKKRGQLYLAITIGIYLVAFFYFGKTYGAGVVSLAIFPALVGSWYFGISGGLLTSFLSLSICIALLYINGYSSPWLIFLDKGLVGMLSLFGLSIFVGYLGRVERQYKRKIARSNQLIHALTQVAAQAEISSKSSDVMNLMGAELEKIGLKALVALFIPGSQELVIRYTSLDPKIIEKIERLSKKADMANFHFSVEDLPAELNLADNLRPILLDDYKIAIAALLPDFSEETIKRIMPSSEFSEDSLIGHFPLIYQEKTLGFLWLWGKDLRETDLPTLSIFSSQVAAALENALLFNDLQRLALTDGLTGLYTRRHFFELAYEEFYRSRRYQHPLSILMLDLDLVT
ncbi:MAG: diguanylate cyclase [Anaerolineae bacterium]|jgi:hypothetical protein|nr:diguanylate cyclase [Anaerolineae bacterium]MBT4312240.1 diguanylate cyclase [Anaerolineae bacterium]MBT4458347.1 diguanylate cyclase [Anaerolineae bacterium]MBT4842806.1 diguanylate cyclase [Anaerolineae bacterium]MBT6059758.1 diguanylate cyclase [Anaerolineae bacterium]